MLAILAPGQGAQAPGMLAPWCELEGVRAQLTDWSTITGLDLERLGTTASADEIRDTAIAQPLIVVAGLIVGYLMEKEFSSASCVAGHSVGEITASAIAGVISPADAMALVAQRGRLMASEAGKHPTGMSAVLGGEREDVISTLARFNLIPANENGAGQIVAAGLLIDLEALSANPPEGARIRPLAVAGAFHSPFMQPASLAFGSAVTGVRTRQPAIKILSNRDGQIVEEGSEAIARIVSQIANPVRWDLCMDELASLGVTGVIEIPPSGTLVGLIKRAHPHIAQFAIKSPEDLVSAREFIAQHGIAS